MEQTFLKKSDFIVFKIDKPFLNLSKISKIETIFEGSVDLADKTAVYFRWSRDGFDFSEWIPLTDYNIFDYLKIYSYKLVYFHIKIELKENLSAPIILKDVNIVCSSKENPKTFVPFSIKHSAEVGNRFVPISGYEASYNPYDQVEAIRLFKELSYQNNLLFGIETMYIKADPIAESKDLFLLEWGLLNHRDPISMKVVVEGNNFNDNKLNFNGFGIDWEMPFEIILDKRYFESNFGLGEAPQKFDAIYIPMQDRLYQVESSELVRDFMLEPTHFKLSLQKYSSQSMVMQSHEVKDFIGGISTGIYDLFDNDMKNEELKLTNPMQLSPKTKYQDVRIPILDANLFTKNEILDVRSLTVSNSNYNFTSLFSIKRTYEKAISYEIKNKEEYPNQCIMFLTKSVEQVSQTKKIKSISVVGGSVFIQFNVLPQDVTIGDYMGILKNNYVTNNEGGISVEKNTEDVVYYAKVVDVSKAKFFVELELDMELLDNYTSKHFPEWSNSVWLFDNCKGGLVFKNNFISNINKDFIGYEINMINHSILELTLNDRRLFFKAKRDISNWQSFIIQILPKYSQISFHNYLIIGDDINKVNSEILDNCDVPEYDNNENYYINLSQNIMTNLRIFDSPLKEEDHKKIIPQQYIVDANRAILIDNCEGVFNSPFVGNVK